MVEKTICIAVAGWMVIGGASLAAEPIGTAFTYQGALENPPGTPLTGTCTFEFKLCDDAVAVCAPATISNHPGIFVSGGIFTVPNVDFGPGSMDGTARWMEVKVHCGNPGDPAALAPRVRLTPSPYSLRAANGIGGPNALNVDGDNVTVGGVLSWGGGLLNTDQLGSMELGPPDSAGGEAPFIDLHYGGGTPQDYSARMQAIADDSLSFSTSTNAELLVLKGGRVGVNNWDPQAALHIGGTPGVDGIRFPDGTLQTTAPGDGHSLDAADGSPVDVVFVDSTGNVGVGTTGPSAKLNVLGSTKLDGGLFVNGQTLWVSSINDRVGIGVAGPTETLDVNGTIRTNAFVKVNAMTLTGAPGSEAIYTSGTLDAVVGSQRGLRIENVSGNNINFVAGPSTNTLFAGVSGATILGGTVSLGNRVTDLGGTVGGGSGNTAGSEDGNATSASFATVGGGNWNEARGMYSTIAGGGPSDLTDGSGTNNRIYDDYGTIGGGGGNRAGSDDGAPTTARFVTISGGENNVATAEHATVGGGGPRDFGALGCYVCDSADPVNYFCGVCATPPFGSCCTFLDCPNLDCVGDRVNCPGLEDCVLRTDGFVGNRVLGKWGTVSGGGDNQAGHLSGSASSATVCGGLSNTASGSEATVGGGRSNTASDSLATVAGGFLNEVSGEAATIGGGWANDAGADFSTVGGGFSNEATNEYATIGGGDNNTASGRNATVSGGVLNGATASNSTVGGGSSNKALGFGATVAGGVGNQAGGDYSFAGGWLSKVRDGDPASSYYSGDADGDEGTFVWSDATTGGLESTGPNRFLVRASGGVWFGTTASAAIGSGRFINTSTGAYLSTGGAWTNACDRDAKGNITPIVPTEVLQRVVSLPIARWSYRQEGEDVKHIGPMAQDFHTAFGLGDSDKSIATIDADGVALAAIQGLYELVQDRDCEIEELRAKAESVEELQAKVAALETLVKSLASQNGGGR